jgi:beta-galactosidase
VDGPQITRRTLLRAGIAGGSALALTGGAGRATAAVRAGAARRKRHRPAPVRELTRAYDFNQGWRFGGVYSGGAEAAMFPGDRHWRRVTVPHTVCDLSWGGWDPDSWQDVWIYRKHFGSASLGQGRVLLRFDGVMANATVYLNGTQLAQHRGGYLPFTVELTDQLVPAGGGNALAVVVDSRWLDQPPAGSLGGPGSVDYLQPGGIYRDVTLEVVPDVFVSDVFAKPVDVLSGAPGLEAAVTIDASHRPRGRVQLAVDVLDGRRSVASRTVTIGVRPGISTETVSLTGIAGVELWSPSAPKLYTVRTTLSGSAIATHTYEVTTGFRQASFELGGFYLNGQRLPIFGLNRHQLFPYTGMAAPQRLQAADAALLRLALNCNMVRCSHYPQSPHFLDACDRLGLMVWHEPPGYRYIGDPNFEQAFLQDVHDMVLRDRNRPSVVVWGTRLDETFSFPTLYAEARQLTYELDGTRQTTGAMDTQSTAGWSEDVFAYDDYHGSGGNAQLAPPIPGVPYIIAESVGALTGPELYRWIDPSLTLQIQAMLHAQVHSQAQSNPGYAGLLAWCGIDYASLVGGLRSWQAVKWPGVLDTFRVPKPGAAVYRSQLPPAAAPVIIPAFYWDFGPSSPATGPGPNAIIATNCEQLQIEVGEGYLFFSATPDTTDYGGLAFPPAVVDLTVGDTATLPDLLVTGYVGGAAVATLRMSSNTALDKLALAVEDAAIVGDGSDATRITFRAVDAYGNQRPYVSGDVTLKVSGPADLVGQNPFQFQLYGGVGGAFVRSQAGNTGTVTVTASHPTLGQATAQLTVTKAGGDYL